MFQDRMDHKLIEKKFSWGQNEKASCANHNYKLVIHMTRFGIIANFVPHLSSNSN